MRTPILSAEPPPLVEAALAYARIGWRVLPLHSVSRDGQCGCGAADCKSPGKHPLGRLVPHGLTNATTDEKVILGWWNIHPDANVGIRTGAESGIVVLDVDPRHGGDQSLATVERQHGPMPHTIRGHSGGGGLHAVLCHPGTGVLVPSRAPLAGLPGLDVKGDGGYIVAPPSVHVSGRKYVWDVPPDKVKPAAIPEWLLALMVNGHRSGADGQVVVEGDDRWLRLLQGATEGQRHDVATRLAGHFLGLGRDPKEVEALLIGFAIQCVPPLSADNFDEVRRIVRDLATKERAKPSPWTAAQPANDFISAESPEVHFLDEPILVAGAVTEIFSPRGLGKTQVAYAKATALARAGTRVLLLDRDNPPREIRRRLKAWGATDTPTLKVMTRHEVPPLTDKDAWATFPVGQYDLVIIDSLDASAEGIGEKESSKPSKAIAPVLDLARRDNGPAILILGNTVRSGLHSRGSGVIEDRADMCFEVRDATEFRPTGKKPWWQELPPAGADAWAERASRRNRRPIYRLAFIVTKFRPGEEPEPFILEVDHSTTPWSLRDVTDAVLTASDQAKKTRDQEHERNLDALKKALVAEIRSREGAGNPMPSGAAEAYLLAMAQRSGFKLSRDAARQLLRDEAGRAWITLDLKDRPGKPKVLVPFSVPSAQSYSAKTSCPETPHVYSPSEAGVSAARMNSEPRDSQVAGLASGAGIRDATTFPRTAPGSETRALRTPAPAGPKRTPVTDVRVNAGTGDHAEGSGFTTSPAQEGTPGLQTGPPQVAQNPPAVVRIPASRPNVIQLPPAGPTG